MTVDERARELWEKCYSGTSNHLPIIGSNWKRLATHVQKLLVEENEFYTNCPDVKIMNDAAKYRIDQLKQEVEK